MIAVRGVRRLRSQSARRADPARGGPHTPRRRGAVRASRWSSPALVYFPITRNYFFADDFLHLFDIRNEDFLPYLLIPRGGHLLATYNAVFYSG